MTHLAMVVPTLDRLGGAERQLLDLSRGLRQRGWRISMITLTGSAAACSGDLASAGIPFLSLSMRRGLADPAGWLAFHRWIRRNQPDILHAHLPHAAWLSRWSRLFAPAPVVLDTVHTTARGSLGRRIGYFCSRWAVNAVTAVGPAAATAWAAAHMLSHRTVAVLPNGVDAERWQPDPEARRRLRAQLGLDDKFVWLTAGRLEPVKNTAALLEALQLLPAHAHLFVAGEGSLRPHLEGISRTHPIAGRVTFLGFRSDLRPWFHAADAFVLPSLVEGLPVSLLEAGACALPSVALDVPGSRDIILHGQTGLLAVPEGSSPLAAAMRALMCFPPADRDRLGRAARVRVLEHFSLGRVLDRWEAFYGSLLAHHPQPSRTALFIRTARAHTDSEPQ